jgi:hypothetical protein
MKNEPLTLTEEIKKYDTETLIKFLKDQEQNLKLNEIHFDILIKEEITGCEFLDLSQEELERWGMPGGPAKRLIKFAKECKELKKKVIFVILQCKRSVSKIWYYRWVQ